MIFIFVLLILVVAFTTKFNLLSFNNHYLDKNNTQDLKGIFVVFVFLSHIRTYVAFTNSYDLSVIQILDLMGQLMVTFFLFVSGYGVFESIKRKGEDYINHFPIKRILSTFIDFAIAVTLFLILGLLLNKKYSLSRILLSYIGWSSIGNSSWYMFVIFVLYILTYISFKICKNYNRLIPLILMTVLSLLYIYIISDIQPDRYSNTFLCYVFGMWYSYLKDYIDKLLLNNHFLYFTVGMIALLSFMYIYPQRGHRLLYYNLTSIIFCFLLVLLMMKLEFKSRILFILGKYLFWIYILQRIPMMILKNYHLFVDNSYIFLMMTMIVTGILSWTINQLSMKIKNRLLYSK